MKSENENLDELISKAIGGRDPVFDFEKWKQQHTEQIADYKEQTASKPHKLLKYASLALSAAAMIFLAVMLYPRGRAGNQPIEYQPKILTAKITLDDNMPTLLSLNRAYQQGKLQAVDEFYEQVDRRTGPRPENLTAWQLIEEMENNSNKSKGNDHENSSYNNTDIIGNAA